MEEQETHGLYDIQTVTKSRSLGYMVSVKVNGHAVDMLVDTGAVVRTNLQKVLTTSAIEESLRPEKSLRR